MFTYVECMYLHNVMITGFLKRHFLQDQDSLVKTKTETKTVNFLKCQDRDLDQDICL